MPKRETKSLPLLLLLALLPAVPEALSGAETPSVPAPAEPPLVRIVPHLDPAARARQIQLEESRRAALRPTLALWCQTYTPAVRPLRAALDEAWDSLGRGWGPASRNLGYPVHEALRPVATLPPLPDPHLDRQLRQAFLFIEEGAQACTKGMPMTARLRWAAGLQALAGVESSLAALSGDCPVPAAAAFTVVVGGEVRDPYASGGAAEPAGRSEKPAAPGTAKEPKSAKSRRTSGASRKPPAGQSRPRRPR